MSKPQEVKRNKGRPLKYTREFLESVPVLLGRGHTIERIAASVKGRPAAIIELCRRHKITLPSRKRLRCFVRLRYSTIKKLQDRALARGITHNELAERLLEVIATDDMFKAVLDD